MKNVALSVNETGPSVWLNKVQVRIAGVAAAATAAIASAGAVPLLAFFVCEGAHRKQVRSVEQPPAIVETEALTGLEFVGDIGEAGRGEAGLVHWVIE